MERKILNDAELRDALAGLAGWSKEASSITRRFEFEDFASALEFVNSVGALAERSDHHPDITFGWGYVEILLTTHDRGGVTDRDCALAKAIDKI
jgi:4a-hydroxytetrahydrobiopterin dehydratase